MRVAILNLRFENSSDCDCDFLGRWDCDTLSSHCLPDPSTKRVPKYHAGPNWRDLHSKDAIE